jgi:prepilin-type N-terminal cleavage/methylation domain-containing protein
MYIMSTRTNTQNGFTLVELLTVIAIIGILASVVFSNLSNARENARDKFAMATMQSIIIQASIHRANTGSYTGLCANATVAALLDDIDDATVLGWLCDDVGGTGFEIQAPLLNGNRYCIDQTKYFGTTADNVVSNHDC